MTDTDTKASSVVEVEVETDRFLTLAEIDYLHDERSARTIITLLAKCSPSMTASDIRKELREMITTQKTYKHAMCIGVGDGTGNLFAYGNYESIERVRQLLLELEDLRRKVE